MKKANLAERAGGWSARNWKKALFGWLAFALIATVVGAAVGTRMAGNESSPGEAGRAEKMLDKADFSGPPVENLLLQSSKLKVSDPAFRATAKDLVQRLEATGGVSRVRTPIGLGQTGGAVAQDGRSLLIDVELVEKGAEKNVAGVESVVAQVKKAHPELRVFEFGENSANREGDKAVAADFRRAEFLSLPITLLIMLGAFGALVAASLPVVLAFSAVLAAIGLSAMISHVLPASDITAPMVLLIGMAVGVDYSLFYLRREREERAAGLESRAALKRTAATSGQAVLISGLTVLIAMAGLLLANDPTFSSMGVATMVVVAGAMIGSLTVLPALLSRLGDKVERGRIPFLRRKGKESGDSRLWSAILHPVLRHPLISVLGSVAVLACLAIPALSMRMAVPSMADMPASFQTVKAYKAINATFPGAQAPADVVVKAPDLRSAQATTAIASLRRQAVASGKMFEPIDVRINADGTFASIGVPLAGNGTDEASMNALSALRKDLIPATVGKIPGATVAVTGETAGTNDFNAMIAARMPIVFSFVLGLAFLLLLVTFRSIVVPIKAIILNLLSVAASYGVLVAVFQWGWGDSLLGFQSSGTVVSWLPLFLFVILFGLSMDYHVFIISRIKELVDRGVETEQAVERSILSTAGTVTAAAVVMVAVFGIFAGLRLIEMKEAGFGLAVAILIDATIIRGVLLPSAMKLLGRWNWYLPRWLEWLPTTRFGRHEQPAVRGELAPAFD
ncbi:MAG: MMPL family transporter [Gaiellaceae bacterium]